MTLNFDTSVGEVKVIVPPFRRSGRLKALPCKRDLVVTFIRPLLFNTNKSRTLLTYSIVQNAGVSVFTRFSAFTKLSYRYSDRWNVILEIITVF